MINHEIKVPRIRYTQMLEQGRTFFYVDRDRGVKRNDLIRFDSLGGSMVVRVKYIEQSLWNELDIIAFEIVYCETN